MNDAKRDFVGKLKSFLEKPGMFVNPETSDTITAFVNGMDYNSEFQFGRAFNTWLSEKYSETQNPFSWSGFIRHLRLIGEIESETELGAINAEIGAFILTYHQDE